MNLLKDGYGLGALLHSSLAKQAKALYPKHAQQKAAGLALTGYNSLAHTVRFMGFFCMCNISMHSHVMAKLERDIFGCAGYLCRQSATFFSLATN